MPREWQPGAPPGETERMGFEPMDGNTVTGFQDRRLKPLGHLSRAALTYTLDLNPMPTYILLLIA